LGTWFADPLPHTGDGKIRKTEAYAQAGFQLGTMAALAEWKGWCIPLPKTLF